MCCKTLIFRFDAWPQHIQFSFRLSLRSPKGYSTKDYLSCSCFSEHPQGIYTQRAAVIIKGRILPWRNWYCVKLVKIRLWVRFYMPMNHVQVPLVARRCLWLPWQCRPLATNGLGARQQDTIWSVDGDYMSMSWHYVVEISLNMAQNNVMH